MIELQFPGAARSAEALPGAAVDHGLLAVVRERKDLERLLRGCAAIRSDARSRFVRTAAREESRADERLRQLVGLLLADRFADADAGQGGAAPNDLHADDAFEALMLGLLAVLDLWPEEDGGVALALALSMPGGAEGDQVAIRLARPRAALWLAPGSILAGISVGTVLKAARWCAIVAGTVTSVSAEAAARTLVEDLRLKAAVQSRHEPLPRLDALTEAERRSLRAQPVLVVLLHGLFGTDLKTFDGFISRLRHSTPAGLETALDRLAASAPHALVQAHAGVAGLLESFRGALAAGGERVMRATDLETRRFVEQRVGLVGWPHDSLTAVDTAATELAALLKKEFGSALSQRIVFVSHSQGGLLARAAALALAETKGRDAQGREAKWRERLAAIVTFGTPHRGAAIAEPGGRGGREMALYLMMLSGTGKPASLGDVLAILGERSLEGIEDVKAFNASTPARENAFVQRLLKAELGQAWPNGGNRPDLMMVGGRLGAAQKAGWRDRAAAAFIGHKLRHDDHDLVVELSSSTAAVLDARVSIAVASDHFHYFDDDGDSESARALDAAVALVWTFLAGEVQGWGQTLEADDQRRAQATARFKLDLKKPG